MFQSASLFKEVEMEEVNWWLELLLLIKVEWTMIQIFDSIIFIVTILVGIWNRLYLIFYLNNSSQIHD